MEAVKSLMFLLLTLIFLLIFLLPIYLIILILLFILSPVFLLMKNTYINKEIYELDLLLINKENTEIKQFNNLTYFEIKCNNKNNNPILLLHGTATCSSATWNYDFINKLEDICSTIYMIDLPYFGRNNINEMYNSESITNALFEFIKSLDNKPIIIGHSFGSFIALQLAIKYPDYIEKIVAISPVGIFKFLGKFGAYWGIFFKLGFPTNFYKHMVYFENTIVGLLKLLKKDVYNHVLKLRVTSQANQIVNKYIKVTPFGVQWKEPLIEDIIKSNVPISLVFGESDSITPFCTGELLHKITNIPYYIIKDASHTPINKINNIKEIIDNCKKTSYNNININLDKMTSFNIFNYNIN